MDEFYQGVHGVLPLLHEARGSFDHLNECIQAHAAAISGSVRSLPPEVAEALMRTRDAHEAVEEAMDQLRQMQAAPLFKFLSGQLLSKTEFHLLAATGAFVVDSYSTLVAFHYDSGERRGYIDREAPLPGVRVFRLKLGNEIAPEDVEVRHLRADQRAFFEEYDPVLYARFRQ